MYSNRFDTCTCSTLLQAFSDAVSAGRHHAQQQIYCYRCPSRQRSAKARPRCICILCFIFDKATIQAETHNSPSR